MHHRKTFPFEHAAARLCQNHHYHHQASRRALQNVGRSCRQLQRTIRCQNFRGDSQASIVYGLDADTSRIRPRFVNDEGAKEAENWDGQSRSRVEREEAWAIASSAAQNRKGIWKLTFVTKPTPKECMARIERNRSCAHATRGDLHRWSTCRASTSRGSIICLTMRAHSPLVAQQRPKSRTRHIDFGNDGATDGHDADTTQNVTRRRGRSKAGAVIKMAKMFDEKVCEYRKRHDPMISGNVYKNRSSRELASFCERSMHRRPSFRNRLSIMPSPYQSSAQPAKPKGTSQVDDTVYDLTAHRLSVEGGHTKYNVRMHSDGFYLEQEVNTILGTTTGKIIHATKDAFRVLHRRDQSALTTQTLQGSRYHCARHGRSVANTGQWSPLSNVGSGNAYSQSMISLTNPQSVVERPRGACRNACPDCAAELRIRRREMLSNFAKKPWLDRTE